MRLTSIVLTLLLSTQAWALKSNEYLPADADLDPAIPSPESVLGWDVGEWRVSHDQLVKYMETLAARSDRVSIRTIGHTYEQRPLLQLTITRPDRQGQLETLRQQHLQAAHGDGGADGPLVLWLGHSVHGNEASGSNASLLVAYYLAASRSEFVTRLLDESIILLDPSFNPDGLNRFASWANANRSMNPVADRNHRVHNEAWPSARTNHYLFDLNRDWLPLVHPESRARIDEYHRWLPHVLTDQHERSRDGYFFQPGVPSRQNPLTPDANLDLTRALANFHAKAMDEAGEIYFTEDDYDDFYYGKGSTYPDINGSIGILYEQPSIKGPVLERDTGLLTFVNAIQNHLRTTLSTLHGSLELKDRLKSYQGDFFKTMARRAADADHAAWIIGDDNDPARARAFLEVMDHHRIEYRALAETVDADGQRYVPGHAWVFPVRQRQFGLLEAIMETRTQFEDDTFYDVSAWTQPLAYNLPYARLQRMPETGAPGPGHETTNLSRESIAWIVPWRQMQAPALLQRLLEGGALVRAATKPFTAAGPGGSKTFARGALVIHAGLQGEAQADRAFALLSSAVENGTQVFGTSSALTPSGPDLGALHFKRIWPIRPLMIVGNGVEQYQAGHAWYQFDQRLGLAPVMVDMYQLRSIRLSDYTHLVMVGGNYGQISASVQQRIVQWVKEGGILVASDKASTWAESLCFGSADSCRKVSDSEEETAAESAPYARFNDDKAQQNIGGAIVATRADTTHPLAYGLSRQDLPLFRRGTTLLSPSDNPYSTPVRYAEEPLLGGFIGPQQQDHIRGKPAVIAEKKGDGLVVRFANNPVFRGFWRGTERLFHNALYMGQILENTELPD